MPECFVDRDAPVRVEPDHALEECDAIGGAGWVFIVEVDPVPSVERLQVLECLNVAHILEVLLIIWSADHVEYDA